MKTEEKNKDPKEKKLNSEESSKITNETPIEKNDKKTGEGWEEKDKVTAEDSEIENKNQGGEEEEERKLKPGKMKPVAKDTQEPFNKKDNEKEFSQSEKEKATETADVELE